MNDDLIEWLGERTNPWAFFDSGRHCLFERYFNVRGWPEPGVPVFLESPGMPYFVPLDVEKLTGEEWDELEAIIEKESLGETREEIIEARRTDEMKLQFIWQTRNEFAEPLSESRDAAERSAACGHLLLRRKSLQAHVEKLARVIDKRFQVKDPSTGESTTVIDEAHELWITMRSLRQSYGSKTLIQQALEVDTTVREWYLDPNRFPTSAHTATDSSNEHCDLLAPLSRRKRRPCISVKDLGFAPRFEWLPGDATTKQLEVFAEMHHSDLVEEADPLGNTHAGLYYRKLVLDAVLQEYDMNGKVSTWERKLAESNANSDSSEVDQAVSKEKNRGGKPPKMDQSRSPDERKKVVIAKLKDPKYWHKRGPHQGKPKWKEIAWACFEEEPKLFTGNEKAYNNDSKFNLTAARFAQLIEEWGHSPDEFKPEALESGS